MATLIKKMEKIFWTVFFPYIFSIQLIRGSTYTRIYTVPFLPDPPIFLCLKDIRQARVWSRGRTRRGRSRAGDRRRRWTRLASEEARPFVPGPSWPMVERKYAKLNHSLTNTNVFLTYICISFRLVLYNLVAIRHTWRQEIWMWRQTVVQSLISNGKYTFWQKWRQQNLCWHNCGEWGDRENLVQYHWFRPSRYKILLKLFEFLFIASCVVPLLCLLLEIFRLL